MAIFFGAQSMQAYAVFGWLPQIFRDAGFSAQTAGLLLGTSTAISIPISFVLPSVAVRLTNQAPLILALCASYAVGYLGLIRGRPPVRWLGPCSSASGPACSPSPSR